MATKKTKSKTKKTKVEPVVEKKFPDIKPGEHTFVMSTEEIYSVVQILGFARDIFKQMSLDRGVAGDTQAEAIYAARAELSDILFGKIRTVASIGEPTSRALH